MGYWSVIINIQGIDFFLIFLQQLYVGIIYIPVPEIKKSS